MCIYIFIKHEDGMAANEAPNRVTTIEVHLVTNLSRARAFIISGSVETTGAFNVSTINE